MLNYDIVRVRRDVYMIGIEAHKLGFLDLCAARLIPVEV